MKKDNYKNIILDCHDVENKIKRISLEILEDNINENKLIFFGVSKNGKIIAKKIIASIKKHSEIDLELIGVEIDINSNNVLKFDKIFIVNNRSLIIVSDLMSQDPIKIKTAVMVNRDHTLFPVKIEFSGLNLSTSMNEHVDVKVNKDEEFTVYLN